MISQVSDKIQKKIKSLPDTPGVYLFLACRRGEKGGRTVLYVGKATSLRDRVRSYFNQDIVNTRSPLIAKMLSQFDDIEFIKTDSVLEALVLEANLIKKYQPEANIKEKDNKSFNYVVITDDLPPASAGRAQAGCFPRVLIVRGRELLQHTSKFTRLNLVNKNEYKIKYKFGPFPNGGQLKEAMKIVRKMFPFRDKCDLPTKQIVSKRIFTKGKNIFLTKSEKNKPCFNHQIGLCPGVCTGEISQKEYAKTIKNIILFFESDKKKLLKNLDREMKTLAKAKESEKADKIKKTIFTLNHIQDISLIKDSPRVPLGGKFRIESYDVAHFGGDDVVGVMTVVEDGEKKISDYRKFKIKEEGNNDTKALSEVLSRRLSHIEWPLPDLIVVDGGKAQKNVMEKILKENKMNIPVVSVVNEQHKPKEILGDLPAQAGKKWLQYEKEILLSNSEAHRFAISYHKKIRNKFLK